MSIRVRFAPSPTGNVHIGNIRVAIFNWLFARNQQGEFLLRVEDTDLERSTPEAINTLLDSMKWLGLDNDETPVFQTKQLQRHRDVADKMIADGFASREDEKSPVVFHISEKLFDESFVMIDDGPIINKYFQETIEIDSTLHDHILYDSYFENNVIVLRRRDPDKSIDKVQNELYPWHAISLELKILCKNSDPIPGNEFKQVIDDYLEKESGGEVNLRNFVKEKIDKDIIGISYRRRFVFFDDLILGRIKKPLEGIRDFVIVRSDGSPIFHLANVVDDVDMKITDVLRGNDHVENTFRHLFLYQAMKLVYPNEKIKIPRFGHFPMITNEQGKPYSKRDGAAFVGEYREMGFFPECLFNMLALCGWNPGDDREIMSRQEMIEAFSLEHVNSGPAQFSMKKILWMNSQYMMKKPVGELIPPVKNELEKKNVAAEYLEEDWLKRLIVLMQPRAETILQLVEKSKYFYSDDITPDPKAVNKVLLKNDGAGLKILEKLKACLEGIADWSEKQIEESLTKFTESESIAFGNVAQPLRVAATGGTASPGIWETLYLVGKARTLARIVNILKTYP